MSKYNALWVRIKENGTDSFKLTFAEIEQIVGLPIDHSFLTYKYEEKAYLEIVARNMKDGLLDIPCFYCRGAWDTEALSIVDRNLCKLLRKAVARKDPKDYEVWEQALMRPGTTNVTGRIRSTLNQSLRY